MDSNANKYILWNPEGPTNPRIVFRDKEQAIEAAKRMAGYNRDQKFYVCKIGMMAISETIKVVDFIDDCIPF